MLLILSALGVAAGALVFGTMDDDDISGTEDPNRIYRLDG